MSTRITARAHENRRSTARAESLDLCTRTYALGPPMTYLSCNPRPHCLCLKNCETIPNRPAGRANAEFPLSPGFLSVDGLSRLEFKILFIQRRILLVQPLRFVAGLEKTDCKLSDRVKQHLVRPSTLFNMPVL